MSLLKGKTVCVSKMGAGLLFSELISVHRWHQFILTTSLPDTPVLLYQDFYQPVNEWNKDYLASPYKKLWDTTAQTPGHTPNQDIFKRNTQQSF